MAHRRKIIAWGVGLGLLLGVAQTARPEDPAKPQNVSIDADHEPLLAVIKRICVAQGLNFVANDAALERAGKISLSLHDVPLETALDVICEAYSLEARVKNRILMVRPRGETASAPADPARKDAPTAAPAERRVTPPSPRLERDPVPAPARGDAAPISTVVIHGGSSGTTTGGGHMVVGTVVEIAKDSVKVKESSGDPRDFLIAQDDEGARASRLLTAIRRLKAGDRIALEYRVVEGHAFITNLVGGGNPQQKP
ncbi:MAG: hypothetical protein ACAI25_17490 [Planctomycetota bacterium]